MGFSRFELENIAICRDMLAAQSGMDFRARLVEVGGCSSVCLSITIPKTAHFQYSFDEGASESDFKVQESRNIVGVSPDAFGQTFQQPYLYLPISNLGYQKGSWVYWKKTLRNYHEARRSAGMFCLGFTKSKGWHSAFQSVLRGTFVFPEEPRFLVSGAPLLDRNSVIDAELTISSPFCLGDLRTLF